MTESDMTEQEVQFINPEAIIHRVQACAAKLDTLKSGEQARDLHDFLQDDFLPMIASTVDQMAKLTIVAMQHENRLTLIEESDLVQLEPELVNSLVSHLEAVQQLLDEVYKAQPIPQIAELRKINRELLDQLKEEMEGEDEDEDEDGGK